jgi:diacylglycerol kinase (ATP)
VRFFIDVFTFLLKFVLIKRQLIMAKERIPFSVKARMSGFRYAFNGISDFFITEHNARIHLAVALGVIVLGLWLSVSGVEWIFLILLIGLVFMAELFNTAIEKLADMVTVEYSKKIKRIKDMSAAAVLVAAITAAIIGLIIFIPRLIEKFS